MSMKSAGPSVAVQSVKVESVIVNTALPECVIERAPPLTPVHLVNVVESVMDSVAEVERSAEMAAPSPEERVRSVKAEEVTDADPPELIVTAGEVRDTAEEDVTEMLWSERDPFCTFTRGHASVRVNARLVMVTSVDEAVPMTNTAVESVTVSALIVFDGVDVTPSARWMLNPAVVMRVVFVSAVE